MAVTIGRARQQNQLQGRLNASRRAEALALAEGQRVDLGTLRQYRQEHVATMAPEQIVAIDQARNRRTKELEQMLLASKQRLAASQEPYRSPSRSGPSHPGRHREGPGSECRPLGPLAQGDSGSWGPQNRLSDGF